MNQNQYDFIRPETVALWTFDNDDASDSSPNHNDLDFYLTNPEYALGRFGRCAYFGGAAWDYMRDSATNLSLAITTFSICLWMKSAHNEYEYQTFISYASVLSTYTYGYFLGLNFDRLNFGVNYGNVYGWHEVQNDTIDPCDGEWHWIVLTRDATYVRFYVDGQYDGQYSTTSLSFTGAEIACIGANYYSSTYFEPLKDGYLDMVHVLGIELSAQDVRKMYAFQMGWL